jgi:iron complex outermembrane receptor protein
MKHGTGHCNALRRMRLWSGLSFSGLAAVTGTAAAQSAAVEGHVYTVGKGAALSGIVVAVRGSARSVSTDNAGYYLLPDVPVGRQVLVFRGIGWRALEHPVDLAAGSRVTVDVTLERQAVVLSELVVSADREARRKSETAVSVGSVDAAAIREAQSHHPADLVNRVAGAWVVNLGGEGHFTSIRQPITTKPVYAFLEDGIPIRSTGFFNHNGLYELNISQAARVGIIKGPGTAVYGSDAVGGVVNVFTRDPAGRPELSLLMEGGRFSYLRALATGSNTWGSNGLRADLNLTRADGFRNEAPYRRQSATLRWDHALGDRTRLKTIVAFSHIEQASDGGSDLSRADFEADIALNYMPITYRRVKALRLSTAFERQTDASLLSATLYGRYNELDIMPSWQLSFDPQVWETGNRSFGLLTRFRRTVPALRSNLSAGIDLEYSPGRRMEQAIAPVRSGVFYNDYTLGEVQYDYEVAFRQAAPYLQAEVAPSDRVHLDFGVRADLVGYRYDNKLTTLTAGLHRRPASTLVSYRRLSPKLGITWDVFPWLNSFASYRAAFRVPSESQLFRQGAATNTVGLDPVKADNYEVGFRAGIGAVVSLEGTAYRLDIHDDILTFFDPANGLRLASNAGATRHRGIELGASFNPVPALRGELSWVHAKHSYEDWKPSTGSDYSGHEIELAPRDLGRTALTVTPFGARGGSVTAEWIHEGSYWMDPENTTRYDGYELGNLFARIPVRRGLELSARLNNITNRRYAESSSFTALQGERLRPGSPRSFFLAVRVGLGDR